MSLIILFCAVDLLKVVLLGNRAGRILLSSGSWTASLGRLIGVFITFVLAGWLFVVLWVGGIVVSVAFDFFFIAVSCRLFGSSFLGLGSYSDR